MKDPEEKDNQAQSANGEAAEEQSNSTQNTNWNEHQQIDEEGNEITPEDVK